MRRRLLTRQIMRYLRLFPAVALVGPRQCGKTTLARSLGGRYFDLEDPAHRLRLDLEWDALLAGRVLVVLDEAQAHPPLFARLRGAIDADRRRHGRFLLLGSVAPELQRHVAESLAGRLGRLELTPFLAGELPTASLDRLWRCGGFPDGGVLRRRGAGIWQDAYLATVTQRDLPAWGLPARPGVALRLLRMLAASQGAVWNASQIGAGLGLSYHTVDSYTDFLEAAFLVRRLRPYFANLPKRLVKSPRIYVRDSGLLHALLGLGAAPDLYDQPWVGASWEGFVIEQLIGGLHTRGLQVEPYFLRTADGHELDLVLQSGSGLHAVEVKLTAQPQPEDLARARQTAALIGAKTLTLVCRKDVGPRGTAAEAVVSLPRAITRLAALI